MSDFRSNLHFTWHLVSQFVSWEFCRYMAEEKKDTSETDVLIFLRNMIVQRTEKSVSDVTKHEIIAKLIMEIKSSQCLSRIACIEPLAESVKSIFPKSKNAINKLIQNLKTFINALETTDESRKEIIHVRIDETVNDFIKEANRILSQPLLLQIVKPWKIQKKVYNQELFENVLKCLCNDDPITRPEAKLIAVSLKEDKVFEKIMREAEAELGIDSMQFSITGLSSQASDNAYSQEFIKNSQLMTEKFDKEYLSDGDLEICIPEAGPSKPPQLFHANSHISKYPTEYPFIHRFNPIEIEEENLDEFNSAVSGSINAPGGLRDSPSRVQEANTELNNASNHTEFINLSVNEPRSDNFNSVLEDTLCKKFKEIYDNQRLNVALSDSDTSDCEKTEVFRFLTPTFFKKGAKKKLNNVVYLSDCESNGSSIRTVVAPDSQKIDPDWNSRELTQQIMKTREKKYVKKKSIHQSNVPCSSSDASFNDSIFMPSTSAAHVTKEAPAKKRRIVALAKSPSIHDFLVPSRRTTPDRSSDDNVPLHRVVNAGPAKKSKTSKKTGNKNHKCDQCSNTYRTKIALHRHIFLMHTFDDDSEMEE